MTKVVAEGTGWSIDEKIYFGGDEAVSGMMSLLQTKGDIMNYGETSLTTVSFPGEYELQGMNIRCWEAGEKLSYLVKNGNKSIALLSNAGVLEVGSFDDADELRCIDQSTVSEIEKLELSGSVHIFGQEGSIGSNDLQSENEEQSEEEQTEQE